MAMTTGVVYIHASIIHQYSHHYTQLLLYWIVYIASEQCGLIAICELHMIFRLIRDKGNCKTFPVN